MTDPVPSTVIDLLQRLKTRTARVAVVGLGHAGLPLAGLFVDAGFLVLGLDTDAQKIARLNRGESPFTHVSSQSVQAWHSSGRFEPTYDPGELARSDAVVVCVPTPLTEAREPDLSHVRDAMSAVAQTLRPGQLVVLSSTTYPGTTRDVALPVLECSGLVVERDFFLAYSPEREDPGNPRFHGVNIPRLVGGAGPIGAMLAQALFTNVGVQVVPVSSAEVAEAAKLLENTYRAVNIALVNELKVMYDRLGIDVWEVIDAAATKPFGFQPFYPGPGWGGHCIPVDPFYLAWLGRKVDRPVRFVELAGEINTAVTAYVVARVADALNEHGKPVNGSRILLLGAAYKRDVGDVRESPALELMDLLWQK